MASRAGATDSVCRTLKPSRAPKRPRQDDVTTFHGDALGPERILAGHNSHVADFAAARGVVMDPRLRASADEAELATPENTFASRNESGRETFLARVSSGQEDAFASRNGLPCGLRDAAELGERDWPWGPNGGMIPAPAAPDAPPATTLRGTPTVVRDCPTALPPTRGEALPSDPAWLQSPALFRDAAAGGPGLHCLSEEEIQALLMTGRGALQGGQGLQGLRPQCLPSSLHTASWGAALSDNFPSCGEGEQRRGRVADEDYHSSSSGAGAGAAPLWGPGLLPGGSSEVPSGDPQCTRLGVSGASPWKASPEAGPGPGPGLRSSGQLPSFPIPSSSPQALLFPRAAPAGWGGGLPNPNAPASAPAEALAFQQTARRLALAPAEGHSLAPASAQERQTGQLEGSDRVQVLSARAPSLPQDVVGLILARLRCVRSRSAAALASRAWREAERSTRRSLVLRGTLPEVHAGRTPACFGGDLRLLPQAQAQPPPPQPLQTPHSACAGPSTGTQWPRGSARAGGGSDSFQGDGASRDSIGPAGDSPAQSTLSSGECEGVQCLDLSQLWPWGESLLMGSPSPLPRKAPGGHPHTPSTPPACFPSLVPPSPSALAALGSLTAAAASANAGRVPGAPSPAKVQAALRRAFPRVRALRVYLESTRDVACLAGVWPPRQLLHLAPVRLALSEADLRAYATAIAQGQGQGMGATGLEQDGQAPNGGDHAGRGGAEGLPAQRQDRLATAEGRRDRDRDRPDGGGGGAVDSRDLSGLGRLLLAYPGLPSLDLSHFLCMPQDIPQALALAPLAASGLRALDLLKLGPRGLLGSELISVAGACPGLVALRCACEMDARVGDAVGDAAVLGLARGCPGLRGLQLVHWPLQPWPLRDQRSLECALDAVEAATTAAPAADADDQGCSGKTGVWAAPGAGWGLAAGCQFPRARPGSPRETEIPADWPRPSPPSAVCVAQTAACLHRMPAAAAVAAGAAAAGAGDEGAQAQAQGQAPGQAQAGASVALSVPGLRSALSLLPGLEHLALILPAPILAASGADSAQQPQLRPQLQLPRQQGGVPTAQTVQMQRGGQGDRLAQFVSLGRPGPAVQQPAEGGGGGTVGGTGAPEADDVPEASEVWSLLDLPSLCPKLVSLELCPLGQLPLQHTHPSQQRQQYKSPCGHPQQQEEQEQQHGLPVSPLFPPQLRHLRLQTCHFLGPGSAQGGLGASDPALASTSLGLGLAGACSEVQSLELWGCQGLSPRALHSALAALAPSLRHLSVLHCPGLPAPSVLLAASPLRPRLLSLELSCPADMPPAEGKAGSTIEALQESLFVGNGGLGPTSLGAMRPEEAVQGGPGGGCAGQGEQQWEALQRVALALPLGTSLPGQVSERLLRPGCPRLRTLSVAVSGDSRGHIGPGLEDFGLSDLAGAPSLDTVLLNLSGVTGHLLTGPPGACDIALWERHYVSGMERLPGLQAVRLWPPCDSDTQRARVSLAAASLLALCQRLRSLTVHGAASEHCLAQIMRAPALRDLKLLPDCPPGGMASAPATRARRASLCRVHTTLTARRCAD